MAELKPCPHCGIKNRIVKVHIIGGRRLPWFWYIMCDNCHFCGKTKLFLWRAIKAWNRMVIAVGDDDFCSAGEPKEDEA